MSTPPAPTMLKRGEELSQLSRLLFDSAATKWYLASAFDLAAVVVTALLGLFGVEGDAALLGALVGLGLLASAYALRIRFTDQYDIAETMRRQSVLTEALGWPIDPVHFGEWQRRAGPRMVRQVHENPREPGWFETRQPFGPARLAEMTIESVFYTRYLYDKLRNRIWTVCIGALIISALVIALTPLRMTSEDFDTRVATFVFLLLPILIFLNLLGWALRLGRIVDVLRIIEQDLQRLHEESRLDLPHVMRAVFEYNCQVVAGFPILSRIYARWHPDLAALWKERKYVFQDTIEDA